MAMAAEAGIELWMLDEVRFQQHGSRCRMWIPPEDSNPVFINPDHTWDCTYAEVAATSDNTFNIVYALGPNWNLNHVRGITSSQNTKFYNINEP